MRSLLPLVFIGTFALAVEPTGEEGGRQQGETAWQRADRIEALERTLEKGSPQQRLDLLNQLARRPESGVEGILDSALRDSDPVIIAAAINAVARSWPTSDQHLSRIRQEAASDDAGVALAAIGALGAIGDDDRAEVMASRLRPGADAAVAASAHAALVRLVGVDAGTDEDAWRKVLTAQYRTAEPQLDQLRDAMSSGDPGRIRQSMHQMLMLQGSRSERAQLLVELMDHRDPAVRKLAAEGLTNIGGAVAVLALANGPQGGTDSSVVPQPKPMVDAVPAVPAMAAGVAPWIVIVAVLASGLSLIGWMLFRSPVKRAEDLQKATRTFRKAMVKNGDMRRLAQTRTKLEETGLFRRSTGASGVRPAKRLGSAR